MHHHKQFVDSSCSERYSGWDDDKAWPSQEWKADELMDDRTGQPVAISWGKTYQSQSSFSHHEKAQHDRTGQPVVIPQRETRPQQFIIGNDETESELSLGSRSFVHRVNDQVRKVKHLLLRLGETPENFTERIIFMSMFNDISCGSRDNEKESKSNANLVSLFAKRFGTGQWSFLGPGSEKKWYSISEDSPQGEWDKMAEKMMLTFAESGHPVFRATSPLSRGRLKSKGGGKLSIHY